MITALNFTDFLYRPRRPEELDTARGGGVVFSQAAHQVDVVRLLAGGHVRSVRATTGAWDPARPTEGAYSALLTFADGAFASLTYSGYAHFDSDEFCGWIGELGHRKDPARYGAARALTGRPLPREEEAALKIARSYGATHERRSHRPDAHNHFGLVVVSCDHADLRPLPNGVSIYGDRAQAVRGAAAAHRAAGGSARRAVRRGRGRARAGAHRASGDRRRSRCALRFWRRRAREARSR